MQSQTKTCQNCKQDFVIEPDDFAFYEKIKVPPPTWCPECRAVRRMLFRNEHTLYKSVCNLCGENIISMYDPESQLRVYCDRCWWSDAWDPTSYSKEYNFSKSFFEQWVELVKQVPLIQLWKFNNVNSDYINYATENKNCYLSASVLNCEDSAYSYALDNSQNTYDSIFSNKLSWCYENIDSQNNYNSIYLKNCTNCIDSGFLFDCVNCQNCFMSSNLRNKKYFYKNIFYPESEYRKKISEIQTGNYSKLMNTLSEFKELEQGKSIHRFMQKINAANCSGNNIQHCQNALLSFNVSNCEDVKYAVRLVGNKNTADIFGAVQTELSYESVAPAFRGSGALFCITNRSSHNIEYSFLCNNSSHCFACVGLNNKSYCIFNKQYTKEEYENLVFKIKKHMEEMPYISARGKVYKYGEFFPPEFSPFSYNETIAQEYYPLDEEQATRQGYRWKRAENKKHAIDFKNENIPEDIKKTSVEIIGKVLECGHRGSCNEQCTEAFRINKEEYKFYCKMNLPLPRLCPNCRHYARLRQRNPLKLWHRKCMKPGCANEFETSYAPDRPEIIYCEQCYNQEVA